MSRSRRLASLLLVVLLPACAGTRPAGTAEEGFTSLFDGRSLDGWRASDAPGSFSVKDGAIVVRGPRSHLFYLGPVQEHVFKDFELKLDVLTFPNANSGVYFHTEWQEVGWPSKGYEVQVNNSHSDPSRTGGLWGIQDHPKVVSPDGQWFTLTTRVKRPRSCGASLPIVRSATAMPAQLTRTCTPPNSFSASATAALPSASEVTSVLTKRPPSSFASFSPASCCMSAMTTLPPPSAAMRAVAAPSPDAPPVTRNMLFLICITGSPMNWPIILTA